MIAGAAALTGAIASTWLIELLVAAIPADGLPLWFDPRIDATVILYVVGIAAVATVLSAAAPGFTVTRGALASTLNAAGARSAGDAAAARMRAGLVAAQIALATVLLSGAGLLLRALSAQRSVDPGYAADAVVEIPTVRAFATDDERFAIEANDRLAGIAGIDAAAAASTVALAGRAYSPANEAAALSVTGEAISASWIATMGLPLIAGRAFASGESGRDVVILSELVARTLFGTASDAVAATLRFEGEEASRARTVVGVVGDRYAARPGGLDGATPTAHAYVPLGEGRTTAIRFIVRVDAGDPLRLAPAATSVLRDIDRDAVIRTPRLLGDVERVQAGDLQFFSWIFNGFGAVALALASIGCWGVVAYSVTRRRKEIGLRIALGASTTRVVREIAGGMARPLGLGLVLGAAGALGLGQLLRGVLFAVAPMDPLTLAAVTLTFAAITGLAAWLPARRAARVDPMRTLRAD
jgi:predicted permease